MTDADDLMVRQMEERRRQKAERRAPTPRTPTTPERRKICSYCFQPGDHQTPAQCLRALDYSLLRKRD